MSSMLDWLTLHEFNEDEKVRQWLQELGSLIAMAITGIVFREEKPTRLAALMVMAGLVAYALREVSGAMGLVIGIAAAATLRMALEGGFR